jgi:hypothetical protein
MFEDVNNLIITSGFAPGTNVGASLNLKISDATVECGMIYLDTDERRRFSQNSHELLIEQVQYTGQEQVSGLTKNAILSLNHPVKEIIWGIHTSRMANPSGAHKYLWYHPTDLDAMRLIATKRFVLALAKYTNDGDIVISDTSISTEDTIVAPNAIVPKVGLSGSLLTKFNSIKAAGVSTDATVDNVAILGDLLSLEDISTPVSALFAGISRPASGEGSALYDVIVKMPHNFGVYIDGSVNPLLKAKLTINGQDRLREQDAAYFNYLQPYEHHIRTPSDGINVYSFALNPEEQQPSGTLNFSRVDLASIVATFDSKYTAELGTDSVIVIYGFSYNVLRIMSGLAGLAYSS